jgi:hypothetical protein
MNFLIQNVLASLDDGIAIIYQLDVSKKVSPKMEISSICITLTSQLMALVHYV